MILLIVLSSIDSDSALLKFGRNFSTLVLSFLSSQIILIYALLGLFCVLGIVSLLKSNYIIQLTKNGSVTGYVINEYNQPVSAEVFIPVLDKTCTTDQTGYFKLDNIPTGDYSLVVGYNFVGNEYPISVTPGSNITLGEIYAPEAHKPYE